MPLSRLAICSGRIGCPYSGHARRMSNTRTFSRAGLFLSGTGRFRLGPSGPVHPHIEPAPVPVSGRARLEQFRSENYFSRPGGGLPRELPRLPSCNHGSSDLVSHPHLQDHSGHRPNAAGRSGSGVPGRASREVCCLDSDRSLEGTSHAPHGPLYRSVHDRGRLPVLERCPVLDYLCVHARG